VLNRLNFSYSACSISFRSPLNSTFSDIILFLHVSWQKKKQKMSVSLYTHVFRKYHLKTIYSGTSFSSFLDFRLILSITALSIFGVEPSAWARLKGILIENITKIKYKKNNYNRIFFVLGELPKKRIFNIFRKNNILL
jgi:hypothetical protein